MKSLLRQVSDFEFTDIIIHTPSPVLSRGILVRRVACGDRICIVQDLLSIRDICHATLKNNKHTTQPRNSSLLPLLLKIVTPYARMLMIMYK